MNVIGCLAKLVAVDTQNPPRTAVAANAIYDVCQAHLPGFSFLRFDEGDGSVSLLATRGQAKTLINVHLDTVPVAGEWTRSPHVLHVEDGLAYGLGACDIKGAAAALFCAAASSEAPAAFLFTSDEERGQSVCIRQFLKRRSELLPAVERAIACEPTQNEAVLGHRGIASGRVSFCAEGGHSSEPRCLAESANHQLGRWLFAALLRAEADEARGALGLSGVRFHCGTLLGGIKNNIIAPSSAATFSVRPPPGDDPAEVASAYIGDASGAVTFCGPALPSSSLSQAEAMRAFVARAEIVVGDAVSFWTEASLFSEAGLPSMVLGPGDIAQAHSVDEWVRLAELEEAVMAYGRILEAR